MKRWLVTFKEDGSVENVTEETVGLVGPQWVIVTAKTFADAVKKANSIYACAKKQKARALKSANGQCACGRRRDRIKPGTDNEYLATCLVCAERQREWNTAAKRREYEARTAQAKAALSTGQMPPIAHLRDEVARVNRFKERTRDRRAEIRLETLLHVRQAWTNLPTDGAFERWLDGSIDCAKNGKPDIVVKPMKKSG